MFSAHVPRKIVCEPVFHLLWRPEIPSQYLWPRRSINSLRKTMLSMSSYAPPNRRTIILLDTLRGNPHAMSMPIGYLAVVGTPNAFGAVFHFRLSLVSQNPNGNKESVRIDMQTSYIGRDTSMHAIALVEYNPYEYSQRFGPEPFLVPVAPGITAAMLLEMIFNQSHMDHFVYPGQGCRHWCASVLDMLAQRQVVDAQVPQWFANYEVVQHTIFGDRFPMPRIRGTFYL